MKNLIYAVFKQGSTTNFAQVIDIGLGGLTVHCFIRLNPKVRHIDLVVSRNNTSVHNLPVKAVTSEEIPPSIPFSSTGKKRYGLQFGQLMPEQASILKRIIRNNSLGYPE